MKSKSKISLIITIILFIVLIFQIQNIALLTKKQQQINLEKALSRDIIECYALEGYYPPDLNYIEEHYGLSYNKSEFFIDYQIEGENIKPTFTIIER